MLIFFLFFTIYMSLTTHFIVSDFWRRLVVHMWVEVTFEILTTVIVAYLYREIGCSIGPIILFGLKSWMGVLSWSRPSWRSACSSWSASASVGSSPCSACSFSSR